MYYTRILSRISKVQHFYGRQSTRILYSGTRQRCRSHVNNHIIIIIIIIIIIMMSCERCHYTHSEAWQVADHLKIWLLLKKTRFLRVIVSILLYGCTIWTLRKCQEKKLENYTRMLDAVLNKSWKQCPTKQQLYGHLLFISQTIRVKPRRPVGRCWKIRTNSKVTFSIHQCFLTSKNLCMNTGCRSNGIYK